MQVGDLEPLRLGIGAGDLEQRLGELDADDGEAAPGQLERVAAVAAGHVEDPLVAAGLQHLQGAVDFPAGVFGPGHVGHLRLESGGVPVGFDVLYRHKSNPAAIIAKFP